MRKQLTALEICSIVGISIQWFHKLTKAGIIPPADDTSRRPYVWYSDNTKLIDYIESKKSNPKPE